MEKGEKTEGRIQIEIKIRERLRTEGEKEMERPRERRRRKALCSLLVVCACEGDGETEGEKETERPRERENDPERYGGTIINQIKRLGASCDWNREHFTLDEQLSRAVIEAFVRRHEKGLIYQGSYMVNWSPSLQTAVSDLEVEYHEESGTLYYLKYRVAGGVKSEYLTIATTRPETLFGDVAIAVHPEVGVILLTFLASFRSLVMDRPGDDNSFMVNNV
ncbi:hypothetical protein ACFX1X_025887 [Malus domestica]